MTQQTTYNRQEDIPTIVNEAGLTWNQRRLFHTLVNDGVHEWNAYTACLSVEQYNKKATIMTQQTTGNGTEATGKSQEVATPASLFIDLNNVMTYGAEKGQYMPIGRCIDDMCACIAELEREAGCIYCNDWV